MSIQFEIDGVIALLQLAHDSGLSFRWREVRTNAASGTGVRRKGKAYAHSCDQAVYRGAQRKPRPL
jgi:hypothetical protein